MKVVLSLALLALVSAQEEAGYEAEPQYEEGVYEPYAAEAMTAVCLGTCPTSASCQDIATGACIAPTLHYTGSEAGRFLSEYEEAAEYNKGEQYSEEACPEGTLDLACNRLGSNVVLWVGFGLLFAPALYFWWVTFHDGNLAHSFDNAFGTNINAQVQLSRFLCFVIVFIASLAYLTMALGYGSTVNCNSGRQFFYVRYIDWIFTTPIMLYKIIQRTSLAQHETAFLIFMDILMIVAGLIGAFAVGTAKWLFFAFAMLTFLPILWYLCAMRERIINNHFQGVFDRAVALTAIIWIQYPIVWILSEGTGTICSSAEAIWYTVLDVLSKALFGVVLIADNANWIIAAPKAVAAAGSFL